MHFSAQRSIQGILEMFKRQRQKGEKALVTCFRGAQCRSSVPYTGGCLELG